MKDGTDVGSGLHEFVVEEVDEQKEFDKFWLISVFSFLVNSIIFKSFWLATFSSFFLFLLQVCFYLF